MSNLSWLSCLPCGTYLVAKLLHVPRSIFHVYCWYQLVISVDHLWKHQFVFVRLWPKMTSTVDSEAHLAKRATEVGLTDGALQSLVRSGFSTLGIGLHSSWPTRNTDRCSCISYFCSEPSGRPDVVSWRGSIEKATFWRAHDGAESVARGCVT